VVREAEQRVRAGEPFPDLNDTLRSIIATSAVSHGVDVEEFNAMFFAGLPSDIAEYIQASSRVGRIHAGFSLLVPVPQRQRDRFVVEIFDIFHRFLERMVLPAAVDRWAEKAIRRVIPSVMQEYLCGVSRICEIARAPDAKKSEVRDFKRTEQVREHLNNVAHREELKQFVIDALGLAVRPPLDGLPYYEALVQKEISGYWKDMDVAALRHTEFKNFFEQRDQSLRPMTSLRDVDLAGFINESRSDALGKKTEEGQTARAMNFIRRGVAGELDDEDDFVAAD
jgi:superfamily II DNA/RNA helicase